MVKDAQSIFPSTHSPHPSWPKQALMSELLEKITFRSSFRKNTCPRPMEWNFSVIRQDFMEVSKRKTKQICGAERALHEGRSVRFIVILEYLSQLYLSRWTSQPLQHSTFSGCGNTCVLYLKMLKRNTSLSVWGSLSRCSKGLYGETGWPPKLNVSNCTFTIC